MLIVNKQPTLLYRHDDDILANLVHLLSKINFDVHLLYYSYYFTHAALTACFL